MVDVSLEELLDQMIEELIRTHDEDAAALASILMAAQSALRAGQVTELALAAWEFLDARRA